MFMGTIVLGVVYLLSALVLFVVGKFLFDFTHRGFGFKEQLIERDNLAFALTLGGYMLGLTIALGGAMSGPPISLTVNLIDIFLYGAIAIVLLNASVWINDWLILHRFSGEKEILQDQNCGVGVIEAANSVAVGLIIYGSLAAGGHVLEVLVFWALGQAALIASAKIYNWMAPFDVQDALEKDNVAVGAAFAGMLLGIGNIVRFAAQGTFVSWSQNIAFFVSVAVFGLVVLPAARFAADRVLLPGGRLTDELVHQEKPNIGVGVIEAVVYVAMSFLIGWSIK
ncbi:MAG: DUF350 domain-containing protein [Syntrophobacteraceae bacterium]|jgi:uncharacterized membrane protein YjfL (UPF0719 family)|nr:DUF350 domain-containing protein [Syntrophobacteraceae bacterium]